MAEGELRASDDAPLVEPAHALFRAGPERDPHDTASACRFLVLETPDGSLTPAEGGVDPANRCVALGDPIPQSSQQQELVCLAAAHANCPRFLRGVLAAREPAPAPARQPTSPAVIGAALVLAAALAMSFGFLAVRGGFSVPLGSPTPAPIAVAPSPSPAVPSPTLAPTPTPVASVAATPEPSVSPPPTPTPTPTASPTPARATPQPSSDRYALLTACPSQPDCWIYVIRSGDNLHSIANWFGVSYDRMIAMNPNLATPIHAGDHLRIPTPTR
jgi:hypothetical protein